MVGLGQVPSFKPPRLKICREKDNDLGLKKV